MIKMFCDACGAEIKRNVVTQRVRRRRTFDAMPVMAEVIVTINSVINAGQLCEECLFRVLEEGISCDASGHLPGEME